MSTHVALFDCPEFFDRIISSDDTLLDLEEAGEHINQFFNHLRKDLPMRLNKYIKFNLPYRAPASKYSWEPVHVFEKRKQIGLKDDFLDVCAKIDSRIETERRTGFETEVTLNTLSDEVECLRSMLKLIEQIINPSTKQIITSKTVNTQPAHRHQLEGASLLASLSPNSLPTVKCAGRVKRVQRKKAAERKSDRSASSSSSDRSTLIEQHKAGDDANKENIGPELIEESEFEAYSEEVHSMRTSLIDEDVSPSPSSISFSSFSIQLAHFFEQERQSSSVRKHAKEMNDEQDPLTVYYFPEFCLSSTIIDPNDLIVSCKKFTNRLNEEKKWKTQEDLRRLYFP